MRVLVPEGVYTRRETPELIARCLEGDQSAYAALYSVFAGDVYRLVYGLLGHREDAEEVVQDTFVYAMRNLARYDSERASFHTWLFIIATSRARNKRRRRWLPTVSLRHLLKFETAQIAPDSPHRPPEAIMESADEQREVLTALERLSPKLREAAILRYFNDLTYREMGQILGIPQKTAESRVRLAHRAIRGLMGQEIKDGQSRTR